MSISELSKDVLEEIGISTDDGSNSNSNGDIFPGDKIDPNHVYRISDMYNKDLLKRDVSISLMKISDLCDAISAPLKQVFRDYLGCKFVMGANGNMEFVMIFEPGAGKDDGLENINVFKQNGNMSSLQRNVEMIRVNQSGRHTMTLNEITKAYLLNWMSAPIVYAPQGYCRQGKVKWNECIQEMCVNDTYPTQYPGMVRERSFLVVRNINVEKIIADLLTPTEVKKADYDRAVMTFRNTFYKRAKRIENGKEVEVWVLKSDNSKTFDMLTPAELDSKINIQPSVFFLLTYKGFFYNNGVQIGFSPMPPVINGVARSPITYDNYFITIQEIDAEAMKKYQPQIGAVNVSGFLADVH